MSQGQLAEAVGLSPSDISRIECGYRDIRPAEAIAFANALGLHSVATPTPAPVAVAVNAAGVSSQPSPAAAPAPAPVAVAPTIPAPSVGRDLADPTNFTELPDLSILERGTLSLTMHRERLLVALTRTQKVLHTSRVRAAVWREWRQFEKSIQALLQATV